MKSTNDTDFLLILQPERNIRPMTKEEYQALLDKYAGQIDQFRQMAHDLHDSVNQIYAGTLPYGFHLDMVAESVRNYGHLVCVREEDVLPLFFAAYYHDSIEDARLTYNDVRRVAETVMSMEQALLATEIVYALTNEKGRNRSERAGEKYYKGIRETPYAPFVKLCDRLANITYSWTGEGPKGTRMREVYKGEMPHFLPAINPHSSDPRLAVPVEVVEALAEILVEEVDKDEIRRQWGEL
jgi:(p)ppGpp synthase/HD superfamily hydrolase